MMARDRLNEEQKASEKKEVDNSETVNPEQKDAENGTEESK